VLIYLILLFLLFVVVVAIARCFSLKKITFHSMYTTLLSNRNADVWIKDKNTAKENDFHKNKIIVILDWSYCPPPFVIHPLPAGTVDDLHNDLDKVLRWREDMQEQWMFCTPIVPIKLVLADKDVMCPNLRCQLELWYCCIAMLFSRVGEIIFMREWIVSFWVQLVYLLLC